MSQEFIIRWCDLPEERKLIETIYLSVRNGKHIDPPEPIRADWLAITQILESHDEPECFILYFLTDEGEILEFIQIGALEDAIEEARLLANIQITDWHKCKIALTEDGLISRAAVA